MGINLHGPNHLVGTITIRLSLSLTRGEWCSLIKSEGSSGQREACSRGKRGARYRGRYSGVVAEEVRVAATAIREAKGATVGSRRELAEVAACHRAFRYRERETAAPTTAGRWLLCVLAPKSNDCANRYVEVDPLVFTPIGFGASFHAFAVYTLLEETQESVTSDMELGMALIPVTWMKNKEFSTSSAFSYHIRQAGSRGCCGQGRLPTYREAGRNDNGQR
ncbi:hypothetical protein BDW62DRAFT_198059 [Aspergillus aurantiobrunneus]